MDAEKVVHGRVCYCCCSCPFYCLLKNISHSPSCLETQGERNRVGTIGRRALQLVPTIPHLRAAGWVTRHKRGRTHDRPHCRGPHALALRLCRSKYDSSARTRCAHATAHAVSSVPKGEGYSSQTESVGRNHFFRFHTLPVCGQRVNSLCLLLSSAF